MYYRDNVSNQETTRPIPETYLNLSVGDSGFRNYRANVQRKPGKHSIGGRQRGQLRGDQSERGGNGLLPNLGPGSREREQLGALSER